MTDTIKDRMVELFKRHDGMKRLGKCTYEAAEDVFIKSWRSHVDRMEEYKNAPLYTACKDLLDECSRTGPSMAWCAGPLLHLIAVIRPPTCYPMLEAFVLSWKSEAQKQWRENGLDHKWLLAAAAYGGQSGPARDAWLDMLEQEPRYCVVAFTALAHNLGDGIRALPRLWKAMSNEPEIRETIVREALEDLLAVSKRNMKD